jgi:hypothetical protein
MSQHFTKTYSLFIIYSTNANFLLNKYFASDPHCFNADPDPVFFLIVDPDPDPEPDTDLFCELNL